jgi:type IV pilus assembly protein PilE
MPNRQRVLGFTLIELLIVVAVIAILAALAYPSYADYVVRSRRGDALAELSRVAQAQERWRGNNANFNNEDVSSAATGLRLVGGTTVALAYTIPSGFYTITIGNDAASPTNYTVMAAAIGGQLRDTNCASLRLVMNAGNVEYWAGPSVATLANSQTNANARRCWSR